MPPPVDLTNRHYGKLTVETLCPGLPRRWLCACVCGNRVELAPKELAYRRTCGVCPRPACLACGRPAVCLAGFCHRHAERWRRWGKPDPAEWAASFRAGRLNTCAVCGKFWNGYHGCRHCSPECLAEWKRHAALEHWHALPPEKKRQASLRGQARAARRRAAGWVLLRCLGCGEEFVGPPRRVTCGRPACRSKNVTRGSRNFRARRAAAEAAGLASELERRLNNGP